MASHATSTIVASLALSWWLSAAAPTAQGAEPARSAHPCAAVVDPSERLACYDAAFPPAVAETAADRVREDFGLSRAEIRERSPALARAVPPGRIEAAVVAVSGPRGAGRTFALDNGQVWRQSESSVLGDVDAGDRIAIRKASFGTYLLITPGRVALRVKRVK
jgi:hypothetical protein